MRRETTNGIKTIVVEPGDERAYVLAMLTQLAGQSLIVALPDDAVFRRPGDLRELKQAAEQANVELTLVIASNEPLRLWARAQGFRVFSSLETCARAPLPGSPPALPALKTSGQFKVPGVPLARQSPRITEPLYARPEVSRVPNPGSDFSQYSALYGLYGSYAPAYIQNEDIAHTDVRLSDTPVDIQLVDVQKALYQQIAEENAQDSLAQTLSLLSRVEPFASPTGEQTQMLQMQPETADPTTFSTQKGPRTIWHDRLLFILVALLVLGIMGGLSFGYLLSLAHAASLSLVFQVV